MYLSKKAEEIANKGNVFVPFFTLRGMIWNQNFALSKKHALRKCVFYKNA